MLPLNFRVRCRLLRARSAHARFALLNDLLGSWLDVARERRGAADPDLAAARLPLRGMDRAADPRLAAAAAAAPTGRPRRLNPEL